MVCDKTRLLCSCRRLTSIRGSPILPAAYSTRSGTSTAIRKLLSRDVVQLVERAHRNCAPIVVGGTKVLQSARSAMAAGSPVFDPTTELPRAGSSSTHCRRARGCENPLILARIRQPGHGGHSGLLGLHRGVGPWTLTGRIRLSTNGRDAAPITGLRSQWDNFGRTLDTTTFGARLHGSGCLCW